MDLFSGQSDNVTAWQSVNAVCLGCLTHGACVGHWTPDYSAMETTSIAIAHVKEDGQSDVICPCLLHDLQTMLDQPVCSMLVYYNQA